MESLVARTTLAVSRSCSSAVAEVCRSVGGSFLSNVVQHRSYADERLDAHLPASPEVSAHPLVDTALSGKFPPAVPTTQTFGAVYDKSAYPSRKSERRRIGVQVATLKPQLTGTALNEEETPVGNFLHASSIVAQISCDDSPSQRFVRGKELANGSGCGAGSVQLGREISTLKQHQQQGFIIDSYKFVEVLKQCSNQRDFIAARQVHDCIIQSGMDKHPYVANSLLHVYVRCGRLQDARRVFDVLEKKDVVTWNTMIAGYADNDHAVDALEVFDQMRQGGGRPGGRLCVSILNACASPLALKWGKDVHLYIKHAGLESDARVGTALLQMYARCGCIKEARQVFENLTNRDVIAWNAMVGAYAKNGYGEEAYKLFLHMQREGSRPNAITYMSILNASASVGALEWVKEVHAHACRAGLESDFRVGGALVHMYAKSGSIGDARVVFDRLQTRAVRTWNIMIGAYAEIGRGVEAYQLFLQMNQQGFIPNVITYLSILNASASAGALEWLKEVHGHARKAGLESDFRVGGALIHMYSKSGCLGDARVVFDKLNTRAVRTWNIMIGAYAENGLGVEAYRLFLQMKQEGFIPDSYTYAIILNAHASAGALEWVKEVHKDALEAGLESDLRVGNALIHMYAKCGGLGDARLVFSRMEKRDVCTWTAMIGGLGLHGRGTEALELFRTMTMDGVMPNETSFVAVLSACCHAGLVDDGHRLFLAMTQDFGIDPTVVHCNCVVDLLGRAGLLEEAKLFIDKMPVEPDGVTWKALLGACRTYGNVELGEFAAGEVFKLEPKDSAAYVVLSNIYAAAGKWEKMSSVRTMMHKRGVLKQPGCTWIEVDHKIHEFVVGDTSHPEAKAIYTLLEKLTEKLKAEGYVPDTKIVLQHIPEEDKELALCSHSEKLAIAYGLLRTPAGQPIRVYKNLRVCSDCHTATKLISKMCGREIIARDANRFHHFKDGVCSCGDYW